MDASSAILYQHQMDLSKMNLRLKSLAERLNLLQEFVGYKFQSEFEEFCKSKEKVRNSCGKNDEVSDNYSHQNSAHDTNTKNLHYNSCNLSGSGDSLLTIPALNHNSSPYFCAETLTNQIVATATASQGQQETGSELQKGSAPSQTVVNNFYVITEQQANALKSLMKEGNAVDLGILSQQNGNQHFHEGVSAILSGNCEGSSETKITGGRKSRKRSSVEDNHSQIQGLSQYQAELQNQQAFCQRSNLEEFLLMPEYSPTSNTLSGSGWDFNPICKTFRSESSASISNYRISKLKCPKCQKIFTTPIAYQSHQKGSCWRLTSRINSQRSNGRQPVTHCRICKIDFPTENDLKLHGVIHRDLLPYFCESCPKSFPNPFSLTRHTLSHKGIKPFECGLCRKTFVQLPHLKTHLRNIHLLIENNEVNKFCIRHPITIHTKSKLKNK